MIKNTQSNHPVERVYQLILNILVTKYLDEKFFDYIYPRVETLAYISWSIGASYHRIIGATPGQSEFVRYMIFNIASSYTGEL